MTVLKQIAVKNQSKRGWTITLNGQEMIVVTSLRLHNPRFGTLEYGVTPQGYDSWCFEEVGGGGSVIVPYVIIAGGLFIGLVQQDRYTMGGKVWNLPRGFLAENETHFEAAQRESGEELRFNLAERFSELPGLPANPNSAFFVTLGDGKGVRFYGLEIKVGEVESVETIEFGNMLKLRDKALKPVSKVGELIFGCNFVPWVKALQSNDMFTAAGIGRLLPAVISKLR